MLPALVTGLVLLLATALLSAAAARAGLLAPVVLLGVGAAASFVPGLPFVRLDPDLVLLLLLPPLLYSAGVNTSWRGFRENLRPILLLAVGCVLWTAAAVAAVAHWALGLPWAVGFILGAIVSPPDAVAPIAVMRRLGMPRRVTAIIEGESLVNDATALVIFSFAVGAAVSGAFSLPQAVGAFALIVAGEAAFGAALGWGALRLRRLVADPRAEVVIALATPFAAFWPPHELGGSGVVAAVAAGLTVSAQGRRLIPPATRLQGFFIWGLVTGTLEGLVFLLTGLQARAILGLLGGKDGWALAGAAALVVATVVVVRFLWVFPATYLPRLLSPGLRARDPFPDWRFPFAVAFTGLRGVVSLAAALSIPAAVAERDLVLALTLLTIVATLVGLGTTLPWVARRLGLDRMGEAERRDEKRAERQARVAGIDAVLAAIEAADARGAPREAAAALRRFHADRRAHVAASADEGTAADPVGDITALQLGLVGVERAAIDRMYEEGRLSDEARRRVEREFDLEEARARHAAESAAAGGVADEPT